MDRILNWPVDFVYEKIKKQLDSYITGGTISNNISLNHLKISIENTKIKSTALNALMLPIGIHSSNIKYFSIFIEFARVPQIKLLVDSLSLVVTPSSIKSFGKAQVQEDKYKKLAQWEEQQGEKVRRKNWAVNLEKWARSFLTQKIIVVIKQLTVCYQDSEDTLILGYPSLTY